MKTLIGTVTIEERNEIQALFERKNGLVELAKIISVSNIDLYDRIVKDMGETSTKFQRWWDSMAMKYNWESSPGGGLGNRLRNGEHLFSLLVW